MDHTEHIDRLFCHLGGRVYGQYGPDFIADYYPYRYAYTFLRAHALIGYRHSELSGYVREFALEHGLDKDQLCIALADLQLQQAGIEASTEEKNAALKARRGITPPDDGSGRCAVENEMRALASA